MIKIIVLAAAIGIAIAIPVDNGVQGDPEVECGPNSIGISVSTLAPYEGHVYVKGRYAQESGSGPECRTTGTGSRSVGRIELFHDGSVDCGVQRERSLEPKGVFVRTTIIVSFHPRFLTKVDRAYTIQCFYMEADKTVSTDIEVSMITTGFQTQFVPMPVCRYEILDSPSGDQVQFAIIGQPVFHKWTCDTDTVDTFCMRVHSCFVDDGQGDRLDLIDGEGCALDRYLVNNLEYPTDLMAQKEVHVFKYADRPALQFQCQITITVKEPLGDCKVEAQPDCPEPAGGGDGDGQPRRRFARAVNSAGTLDVASTVEVLDVSSREAHLPNAIARPYGRQVIHDVIRQSPTGVCLSSTALISFGFMLAALAVGGVVAVIVTRRQ